MDDVPKVDGMGGRRGGSDRMPPGRAKTTIDDLESLRTRNTHDRQPTFTQRGRYGRDRIVGHGESLRPPAGTLQERSAYVPARESAFVGIAAVLILSQ